MYENDKRIVLTLDAGGTNFVFSAIQGCEQKLQSISLPAITDDLDKCLIQIQSGFEYVIKKLDEAPVAISFAFPGPADYENGIIGDLPNLKCFRGGVALGPFLMKKFKLPVFINNDGNLFAYGESAAGFLPYVNRLLEEAGNAKRYKNLIGITLGTGFGAGVVIDGKLLKGDNGCGGDVWLMRNKKYPEIICEESVSARAVIRVYRELTGADVISPKEVFEIAEGRRPGDKDSAIKSFEEFGESAAAAVVNALNIIDGLVVVGGGISAAYQYIIPSFVRELRGFLNTFSGEKFSCLQMKVYDIENRKDSLEFLKGRSSLVEIPGYLDYVNYSVDKKTCIGMSRLGTSHAVSIGAYAIALSSLDSNKR